MKKRYALILFVGLVFAALVVAGVTNSLGTIDVEIPIPDSWLVNGSEIEIKTINGEVLVQRRVKVEKISQTTEENIEHGLRSAEGPKKKLKVAAVSTGEAIKESYSQRRNGRPVRTGGVFTDHK